MAETTEQRHKRRHVSRLVGIVMSDKMEKTISVKVFRLQKHKRYKKYIRLSNVFKAHDETNKAKVGDQVEIVQSRPMSKTKRWRLSRIIGKDENV